VLEPRSFPGVVREAGEVRRVAAVAVRGFEAPRLAEGLASAWSVVPLVASAGLLLAAAAPLAASLAEGLVLFFVEELVLPEDLDRAPVLGTLVRGARAAR
jgi:hypothetical protein